MMGYTHYWKQSRDFTKADWQIVCDDIAAIIAASPAPLADWDGAGLPEVTPDYISFNGSCSDSHETFIIRRKRLPLESWQSRNSRGNDFTKTARKPYDIAVTACLSYLATMFPVHFADVSTDGSGADFIAGVDLARLALPRLANQLDIPLSIMKDDVWTYEPRIRIGINESDFDLRHCVNGKVYVFFKAYAVHSFADTDSAVAVLQQYPGLACGYSCPDNRKAIAKRQNETFRRIVASHASQALDDIPAFVRPM